jgi:Fe-S cluster assembly protein SufD
VTVATATDLRLPLDRDLVERLSRSRQEPPWLLEARLVALERYTETPWPSGQEEEWRRFPLKGLPRDGSLLPDDAARGRVQQNDELPDADRRKGVLLEHFTTAVERYPDLIRAHISDEGGVASHHAFRELARALFANGSTFAYVPRDVVVSMPLVMNKRWPAGAWAIVPRTIVVAEAGSRVTVVEDLASDDGPARLAVPLLEVHAGPGAEVRYVRVQRFAPGVWDLGSQLYTSASDSRLESYNVLVGTSRTKLGVLSDIRGNGAQVKLYGLVAAGDEQRIDVNSLQRLDGRASQSDLLYLSALYDSAKATYYGVVRVEPTSHGTGSYQECRNLLLSDKAGANPIPVLEILTNDVARCGHGATAGRMDEEEIFYVLSRGVDRKTAEQLLVRGSFARVIDRMPDPAIRARVLEALRPRIGSVAELEMAAA